MKKLLFTLATCLFALSLTANPLATISSASTIDGIHQNTNTPSAVALKFIKMMQGKVAADINLLYSVELEEVYSLYEQATPELKKTLDAAMSEAGQEAVKALLGEMPEISGMQCSVLKETISADGKTAVVKLELTLEEESSAKDLPLIKHQGKWKVNVDKF